MQPISFQSFVPPAGESIFSLKSVVFELFNICTGGLYGVGEIMSKQYCVKELKLVQEDLTNQAVALIKKWSDLERELTSVLEELRTTNEEDDAEGLKELRKRFNRLVAQKEQLQGEHLKANSKVVTTLAGVALEAIFFVGHLIANLVTIGLYGVVMNYKLKNRITNLDAENKHIQTSFEAARKDKFGNLQKIGNAFEELYETKEENGNLRQQLDGILEMPDGQAAVEALKAKSDLAALQKKHDVLQNDVAALKAQKAFVENAKKDVDNELAAKKQEVQNLNNQVIDLNNREFQARQERDRARQDVNQKDNQLVQERAQKGRDLANLQVQLNVANAKANQVNNLQKEIDNLKAANKAQPEATKLHSQLGPIPPKYNPGKPMGETTGAVDLDKIKDKLTPEQIQYYEDYNKRYGDKNNAVAIVEASFKYAFDTLIEMGKKGNKIKLNDSFETSYSRGRFAVYRYMILDIIKGGTVKPAIACDKIFKLSINDNVHMLPSVPERVMQFKKDGNGGLKPEVKIAYRMHDDFTPDEETLNTRDGVDVVSAKWILEQLTDEEKEYLFTHLMDPVIENSHPDHQKMRAFMQNSKDPRVQLVLTASSLIQDMAAALEKKFLTIPLNQCWDVNANGVQDAFIKKDDVAPTADMLKKIEDEEIEKVDQGTKVVAWELDKDVLGDKRAFDVNPRQSDFYDMMMMSQFKYRTLFEHLNQDMLLHPEKNKGPIKTENKNSRGKRINCTVSWDMVDEQYRHCHQMIGSDTYANGGQRCLFSNLLAVLATDQSQLTVDNVLKLKNAMAAYLDKLQAAKVQWSLEKLKLKPDQSPSKEIAKLEEMAKLAGNFENGIRKTHSCSVSAYQQWLRSDGYTFVPGANINISNLTTFEVMLLAHTLGVRIGVLPINNISPAIVNDMGLILPEGEFYGPNTKEFFLIGIEDFGGGGTYHGLYPKLKHLDEDELGEDAFEDLLQLENYWNAINLNTNKT